MVTVQIILGVGFLIYGLLKILVSVLALSLASKSQAKLTGTPLGLLITNDKTYAGSVFDVALILYALYSILHGLELLGVEIPFISTLFMSMVFKAAVYISLGLFLTIYYSLVLYTDMPISKTQSQFGTYRVYILIGILFLLSSAFLPHYGRWM